MFNESDDCFVLDKYSKFRGALTLKSYFTVNDLLERKHFEKINVIAGKEGLHRQVKWVHVVEVTNIRKLLNGNELILSTGVAWRNNDELFVSLLEQLIDADAAGLCIEIGTYTNSIPSQVINLANKFQFPIILFLEEVPFVEITQDIHTLLINHQYQIISDLESYSQALNKKLLTIEHYIEILKFIHQYLKVQVMITFSNREVEYFPELDEREKVEFVTAIEGMNEPTLTNTERTFSFASTPIHLLGDNYAELTIIAKEGVLSEFELLILDRTATALAQLLLREMYVEEKRRVEETEWISRWLNGEQNADSINEYLRFHSPKTKPKGAVVCFCKHDSFAQYSNLDLTYFKLYFRTILEQQGFYLFAIEKQNAIIFIILNERNPTNWKKRLLEAIDRLLKSELKIGRNLSDLLIGVGKFVEELTNIHISYQTSLETIRIQERLSNVQKSFFYDDLHIFRLISLLNRHVDLHMHAMEYLQPVIDYDKKYNGKLLETLKTLLACNGSKQETAKRLFIVRQTLYHRIQKLEKLLGPDFMEHEKRLAIEFMILAYEFIQASKES